mmetsp:Transcript_10697/g.12398  ORF Transcript_10697/g.12398 Transcript_10697/m.12398 type:complete len:335 (+) Transcript_10697:826-1830(+)
MMIRLSPKCRTAIQYQSVFFTKTELNAGTHFRAQKRSLVTCSSYFKAHFKLEKSLRTNGYEYPLLFMAFSSVIALMSDAQTLCQKTVPPQFGKMIPHNVLSSLTHNKKRKYSASLRKFSDSKDISADNNQEDCPLCKKYSQGPCGILFKKWLACVDCNKNDETACDDIIQFLDTCLKEHQEYYEKKSMYNEDKNDDEGSVLIWKDFIAELESGQDPKVTYEKFPSDKIPEMQVRLKSNVGIVQFHSSLQSNNKEKHLLLAYVKDVGTGAVLAAASVDDLLQSNGEEDENEHKCVLRFHINDKSRDVVACALYDELSDTQKFEVTVYCRVERLPI